MSKLWKREKHRILAAAILAMFVLFLIGTIIKQQEEIDDLKEHIWRIAGENEELREKVFEMAERGQGSVKLQNERNARDNR